MMLAFIQHGETFCGAPSTATRCNRAMDDIKYSYNNTITAILSYKKQVILRPSSGTKLD